MVQKNRNIIKKRKGNMSRILSLLLLLGMSTSAAFADTAAAAQQGGNTDAAASSVAATVTVTQKDIAEGLAFCREFPVSIQLDGKNIESDKAACPPVIINGRTLIPARTLFEAMGAEVTWKQTGDESTGIVQNVTVKLDKNTIELTVGSGSAKVNGQAKSLEVPALIIDHDGDGYGSTMVPVRFLTENLGCGIEWVDATRTVAVTAPKATEPEEPNRGSENNREDTKDGIFKNDFSYEKLDSLNENASKKLIFLDAGHGGKDSGSIGHEGKSDQLYEKTVNLKVALMVRDYLEEAGGRVYMERETDVYSKPADRGYLANEVGADIYIALHNNSAESSAINGTEVLYYDKVNADGQTLEEAYGLSSKALAEAIQKEMLAALGRADRGIKSKAAMAVLNKSVMPAVIVEGAFISNEEEFQLMKTEEYAKRYAYAVSKALIELLNETY